MSDSLKSTSPEPANTTVLPGGPGGPGGPRGEFGAGGDGRAGLGGLGGGGGGGTSALSTTTGAHVPSSSRANTSNPHASGAA